MFRRPKKIDKKTDRKCNKKIFQKKAKIKNLKNPFIIKTKNSFNPTLCCTNVSTVPRLHRKLCSLTFKSSYKLKNLPTIPSSLRELDCSETGLESLPKLPHCLEQLWLPRRIKICPKLPSSLMHLNCWNCINLKFLHPNLSEYLQILHIHCCESLETIPKLPDSMKILHIFNCEKLYSLEDSFSCNNLLEFYCLACPKIKTLPKLPNSLRTLDCSNCKNLRELPKLPNFLEILKLHGCTSIIKLPETYPFWLRILDCSETRICKDPRCYQGHSEIYMFTLNCPWLNFLGREKRISDLTRLQKFFKKYLFSKRLKVFSLLKQVFPKDLCLLIYDNFEKEKRLEEVRWCQYPGEHLSNYYFTSYHSWVYLTT